MAQEKVRVYALAKMLNMESKALLDICQELGYDVKNQLSGLDPDQRDAIEQRVKRGHGGGTATLAPPRPVALVEALGRTPDRQYLERQARLVDLREVGDRELGHPRPAVRHVLDEAGPFALPPFSSFAGAGGKRSTSFLPALTRVSWL